MNYCAGYHPPAGEPAARHWPARRWPGSPGVSRSWSATASTAASSDTSTSRCRPTCSSVRTPTRPCCGTSPHRPGRDRPADRPPAGSHRHPSGQRSSGSRPRVSGTHQNSSGGQGHRQEGDARRPAPNRSPTSATAPKTTRPDRGADHPGHQEPARHRGAHPGGEQLVEQGADGRGQHGAGHHAEHVPDHQGQPAAAVGDGRRGGDPDHPQGPRRTTADPVGQPPARPAARPVRSRRRPPPWPPSMPPGQVAHVLGVEEHEGVGRSGDRARWRRPGRPRTARRAGTGGAHGAEYRRRVVAAASATGEAVGLGDPAGDHGNEGQGHAAPGRRCPGTRGSTRPGCG